jgi:hypothetical protein
MGDRTRDEDDDGPSSVTTGDDHVSAGYAPDAQQRRLYAGAGDEDGEDSIHPNGIRRLVTNVVAGRAFIVAGA